MLVLQYIHCAYHPHASGLVKHTNRILKISFVKLVQALQMHWHISLPLVLYLGFTFFGTYKLSPFEIAIGCPVHLGPASFDSKLMKGEIF